MKSKSRSVYFKTLLRELALNQDAELSLNRVLACREVGILLVLLRRFGRRLYHSEFPSDGSGLFGPEVQRKILLSIERFPQVLELVLTNDSQNLRDRQPHFLNF